MTDIYDDNQSVENKDTDDMIAPMKDNFKEELAKLIAGELAGYQNYEPHLGWGEIGEKLAQQIDYLYTTPEDEPCFELPDKT